MIFYFSATGNSLWVAKQVAARCFAPVPADASGEKEAQPCRDTLLSIPQVLGQTALGGLNTSSGNPGNAQVFTDDAIGIVCPVYCHDLPQIVKEFIGAVRLETPYLFFVLTYGNKLSGAPENIAAFCQSAGLEPAYIGAVKMVDNFLPSYDIAQQLDMDKPTLAQLDDVCDDISARAHRIETATASERAHHERSLEKMSSLKALADEGRLLSINRECTRCGTCAQVCPRGNWAFAPAETGYGAALPTFCGTQCEMCFACTHACPAHALGFTIPEANPTARYRHPEVVLSDLITANRQGVR